MGAISLLFSDLNISCQNMKTISGLAAAALFIGFLSCVAGAENAPSAAGRDWAGILGPAQAPRVDANANLRDLLGKVTWGGDLAAALEQAKKENRPVFVTLRCLPCKQCSAFDKDVLEGGEELDPLLKQFITVRLIDANTADLRILPMATYQDLDLSWWGYFLSPEGRVYGVFGGRDEVSDATRISKAALITTLRRVLAHHNDPRRAAWDIDGPAPDLTASVPKKAVELPGYASWDAHTRRDPRTIQAGCVHCHQVSEILREPAIKARTFDKHHDLGIWPLPENVGIKLDRDDGLRITGIIPGSAAEKAGIKPGDSLAAAGSEGSMRKLFGQADFRGILHRAAKGPTTLDIYWLHDEKPVAGKLVLSEGWRTTDLGWRKSITQGNIGCGPSFWPMASSDADRTRLGIAKDVLLVKALYTNGPAKAAGLQINDFVIAVDGEKPNLSQNPFNAWFRMSHDEGDPVTLTVLRNGQQMTISYKAAPWAAK